MFHALRAAIKHEVYKHINGKLMTKKSSEPLDYVRLPTLQWWRIIAIVFMLFCSSFNAFRRNTIHQNHFHCENLKFLRHPNRMRFCVCVFAVFQPQIGLASLSFYWHCCSPSLQMVTNNFLLFSHSLLLNFKPFAHWKLFTVHSLFSRYYIRFILYF